MHALPHKSALNKQITWIVCWKELEGKNTSTLEENLRRQTFSMNVVTP